MINTKRMVVLDKAVKRVPAITNIDPANNTINVPGNKVIIITFNEPIKAGSTYNNIILWNNNVNYYKASTKTINGNTLTITPNTLLVNGHNYSILIPTNSITDLAGNPLQNPVNSTFTVDGTPE